MNSSRPGMLGVAMIAMLDVFPHLRPRVWRWWYDALARHDVAGDLMLMNFGFENGAPLALEPAQEPYRFPLQLYERVARAAGLEKKVVVEVGSGRGGGAAFLAERFHPASYLGVDLSPQAVAWGNAHHGRPGLSFATGRADALPCADASVDVVLNVESSHCYPSMQDFLREVARVLRPGGSFAFCDLRTERGWEQTRRQFSDAGLTMREEECINEPVLRALDQVAAPRAALIAARVPRLWQRTFRDFTGVRGGALYTMLRNGRLKYMRVLAGSGER